MSPDFTLKHLSIRRLKELLNHATSLGHFCMAFIYANELDKRGAL